MRHPGWSLGQFPCRYCASTMNVAGGNVACASTPYVYARLPPYRVTKCRPTWVLYAAEVVLARFLAACLSDWLGTCGRHTIELALAVGYPDQAKAQSTRGDILQEFDGRESKNSWELSRCIQTATSKEVGGFACSSESTSATILQHPAKEN